MSNSSDSQQHYLELLSRFSADLIGKTKVEDVLWCITENAIAELGFEDCVVYLLSESGEYLIQKAAYGPKKGEKQEVVEPIKIEVGTGVVGHVAKTGVAEIVKDCSLDPRYIEDDAVRNSEITVPILKDGQVIGIIDSEHSQTGYYTEEHLSVLRAIAEIATIRLTQIKFTSSVVRDKELLAEEVAETKEELQMAMRQLQKSNDQLEVMVEEKNHLLRELHHRVKNQMQMMHSLINLQSSEASTDLVHQNLLTCMNRVRCMGLVYQMAEGLTIDIGLYLRTLNEELHSNHGFYPASELKIEVNKTEISTEKAILLGFILVDLFSTGIEGFEDVVSPRAAVIIDVNEQCHIQFQSNWWAFEKVGELTEVFIQQIGAERIESETGLHMVCEI